MAHQRSLRIRSFPALQTVAVSISTFVWNISCSQEEKGLISGQISLRRGPMRVGDLIGSRKEVFTITEETSVHQAAQYLRAKQVRTVGVLSANGKLTGVISQSDISDKVAAENKCPAWMKAADIMTRELVTVTAERTLDECLLLMEQNGIFHLIVLDEAGEFRGMLSVKDILRVVASDEKARADLLESFIFPQR